MESKTAIIVLNWNGLADTRECLYSLLKLEGTLPQIYLVDNGSTDGSIEALKREFPDNVIFIENSENLLYAGGNNVGIQRALDDGCSHLLLLNNDVIVDSRLLMELTSAAERYRDAVLCPKIYFAFDPTLLWYAGGILNLRRALFIHRGHLKRDHGQFDREEPTDWATGCALFASAHVFKTTGLLDDCLGLYNEDVDFSLRVRAYGFPILYVPAAKLWHKVSASQGGNFSRQKLMRKWASLNRLMHKHLPTRFARIAGLSSFIVRDAPRLLWRSIRIRKI